MAVVLQQNKHNTFLFSVLAEFFY